MPKEKYLIPHRSCLILPISFATTSNQPIKIIYNILYIHVWLFIYFYLFITIISLEPSVLVFTAWLMTLFCT